MNKKMALIQVNWMLPLFVVVETTVQLEETVLHYYWALFKNLLFSNMPIERISFFISVTWISRDVVWLDITMWMSQLAGIFWPFLLHATSSTHTVGMWLTINARVLLPCSTARVEMAHLIFLSLCPMPGSHCCTACPPWKLNFGSLSLCHDSLLFQAT